MGRVIAVTNQKGGVGKTTTAINLAASLAAAEVNTLLVDCDPQSNSTSGLGLAKDPDRISIYDVLMGSASAEEALHLTELEQLWLIPSHKNLIGANIELVEADRREYRLRDALAPPAGALPVHHPRLPSRARPPDPQCPRGCRWSADPDAGRVLCLGGHVRAARYDREDPGGPEPRAGVEGVVLTMFDERTNLAQQVADELKKYFGDKLCTTTIPRNIRLAEAPSHGQPALVYDVRSRGAESYIRLAKEILERQAKAASGSGEAA